MAKLKGPLFSLGASGTLAKTIVFGNWKGVDYARQHVVPANPKTAAQTSNRDNWTTIVNAWHNASLYAEDKTAYHTATGLKSLSMTGFNYYMQIYRKAQADGKTLVYFWQIKADYDSATGKITVTGFTSEVSQNLTMYVYNANGTLIGNEDTSSDASGIINWTSITTFDSSSAYLEVQINELPPRPQSGFYKITVT